MKSYNLQYYVDKLKKGELFSLARYGDGELYCMWGKKGGNSNGCRYSPELRAALLDSMRHRYDPSFIYGLQAVLPHDAQKIKEQYPTVDWHDSEIFGTAVAEGKLYPLIEQLRVMNVVIIGNQNVIDGSEIAISKYNGFIGTPASNAFDIKDKIISAILDLNRPGLKTVFLFSCGMAANAIIAELHGKINGWLIDVGHIWDPFTGNMSRCDLEGKTMEDINKNLHPWSEPSS